jgi:hypothetical protein
METLIDTSTSTIEDVKNAEQIIQQEKVRNWLRAHASDEVSEKFDQRHHDSVLIQQLKHGLRAERRQRQELENSLLYAGVDTRSCQDIVDCGDSLSECLLAVNNVAFKHEEELQRLRDSMEYIDKKSNNQLASMLNPSTVITEFRRKLIFHALMGTGDVHLKREHAADILETHTSLDPRPKKKVNLKIKSSKYAFLNDSLDQLVAEDRKSCKMSTKGLSSVSSKVYSTKAVSTKEAVSTQETSAKGTSTKGRSSKGLSAKLSSKDPSDSAKSDASSSDAGSDAADSFKLPPAKSPARPVAATVIPMSAEERAMDVSFALEEAENVQLDDDDLDEFEYSNDDEDDRRRRNETRRERKRMLTLKKTAFQTPQAFKPEWSSYDVMRHRWKNGGVRPTISQLELKKHH